MCKVQIRPDRNLNAYQPFADKEITVLVYPEWYVISLYVY